MSTLHHKHLKKETSLDVSSDPLEILTLEQQEELNYCALMEAATASIRTKGFSKEAFEQIGFCARALAALVRKHHDIEENILVPASEHHRINLPTSMKTERRELNKAFMQLIEVVKDVEDGKIYGNIVSELHQTVTHAAELLKASIAKKNNALIPLAKKAMTVKEYNQLKKEFYVSPSEPAVPVAMKRK